MKNTLPELIELERFALQNDAVFVFKVDGERESARYTVVISGRGLNDNIFRRDGDDPGELLALALKFVRARSES